MKQRLVLCIVAVCFGLMASYAQNSQQDELAKILKNEIDRGMALFQKADIPVYLISYRVDETETYSITTSFGTLAASNSYKDRVLTVQVRVGDKTLDNFHELRDDASAYTSSRFSRVSLPVDNDPKAIALAVGSYRKRISQCCHPLRKSKSQRGC